MCQQCGGFDDVGVGGGCGGDDKSSIADSGGGDVSDDDSGVGCDNIGGGDNQLLGDNDGNGGNDEGDSGDGNCGSGGDNKKYYCQMREICVVFNQNQIRKIIFLGFQNEYKNVLKII